MNNWTKSVSYCSVLSNQCVHFEKKWFDKFEKLLKTALIWEAISLAWTKTFAAFATLPALWRLKVQTFDNY